MKPRLGLLAILLGAVGPAHGAGADPTPFLGSWVFRDGALDITCTTPARPPFPLPLAGIRVAVRPGAGADLELELGCNCHLGLAITGTGTAELVTPPQDCGAFLMGEEVTASVRHMTLVASAAGLAVTLDADAGLDGPVLCTATLASSPGGATLVRAETPTLDCGDDDTAVGVVPFSRNGDQHCGFGAGKEGVEIIMHDEDAPVCNAEPGSAGEGRWVLPDETRVRRRDCQGGFALTRLRFCRVDGRLFKPMTSAQDPAQYFAVLKLGTRCPPPSIEVSKIIDNEDQLDPTLSSVIYGRAGQNQVSNEPGSTATTLYFCYFRNDATTMAAFPDLGFRYSVFHSYTGEQPPWVIAKSWQYSNDEDHNSNRYVSASDAIATEFQQLIENTGGDTYFDLAWVR